MRRVLTFCVVSLVAAGCRDAAYTSPSEAPLPQLSITESPSPYRHVTAGPVQATLPDSWQPEFAGPLGDARQGLVAGPRPNVWHGDRPPVEGYAAMWIDGTRVGVPSDYYYLAATSSVLEMITRSERCDAVRHRVIADHRPAFAAGEPDSPGDYVATGRGTCNGRRHQTRWAYFVAAPGYGPVRDLGIPTSGLYVVVAVVPDSRRAPQMLGNLLERTEFGGATVAELMAAAEPVIFPIVGPV